MSYTIFIMYNTDLLVHKSHWKMDTFYRKKLMQGDKKWHEAREAQILFSQWRNKINRLFLGWNSKDEKLKTFFFIFVNFSTTLILQNISKCLASMFPEGHCCDWKMVKIYFFWHRLNKRMEGYYKLQASFHLWVIGSMQLRGIALLCLNHSSYLLEKAYKYIKYPSKEKQITLNLKPP